MNNPEQIEQPEQACGARLELEICDLNIDGSAVARADGRVYFVDRGLPGERLLAEVTGQKKRTFLARALKTITPSPDQVEPFCPSFGSCRGCTFQNLAYPAQLRFKQSRAAQVLFRIGKIDLFGRPGSPEALLPEIIPSPRLTGYRNKMEYAFGVGEDGRPALGLKRRASNEVLDLTGGCPLQSAAAGAVLGVVRAWAGRHNLPPWTGDSGLLCSLILREPEYAGSESAAASGEGRQRSAELICAAPPAPALLAGLWDELRALGLTSLLVTLKTRSGSRRIKLFGPGSLWERFDHLLLEFPLGGFAQTNTGAAALLYARAAGYAALRDGETLWDIYSGAGALAFYIGKAGTSLYGLEQNEGAVRAAKANAARLGFTDCRFEAGEAARLLPALAAKAKNRRPDLLVSDPPRGGMSGRVLAGIIQAAPKRLVYVSCDPATLARDLLLLGPHYKLRELCLVDMFPHTPHLETVALLTPRQP